MRIIYHKGNTLSSNFFIAQIQKFLERGKKKIDRIFYNEVCKVEEYINYGGIFFEASENFFEAF